MNVTKENACDDVLMVVLFVCHEKVSRFQFGFCRCRLVSGIGVLQTYRSHMSEIVPSFIRFCARARGVLESTVISLRASAKACRGRGCGRCFFGHGIC